MEKKIDDRSRIERMKEGHIYGNNTRDE